MLLLDNYTPETYAEKEELKEVLGNALQKLLPRDREVLLKRVYDNKTLEELSNEYHITKERVRQIYLRAVRKIKRTILTKI